ncbi:MAG: DUF2225 domain-containing protein [Lachnospiraceae bacterium]|nr:DUF2225 domain-containing protein [Lachnospiraceae bacterium]
MSILSGLGSFGLGDLMSAELFEDDEEKEEEKDELQNKQMQEEIQLHSEHEFIFLKSYSCPVCNQEFKNPTVRYNRARKERIDPDLRVRYSNVDPLKYGVIGCPNCGYAALANQFDQLSLPQIRLIRENISVNFSGLSVKEVLDYRDAYSRYELALANAIVKRAADSEKANLCLKLSWLLQSRIDNFDQELYFGEGGFEETEKKLKSLRTNALDGFRRAKKKENPPICGMDNSALNYLMSVLAFDAELYTEAEDYLAVALQGGISNKKMKKMALDLEKKLRLKRKGMA